MAAAALVMIPAAAVVVFWLEESRDSGRKPGFLLRRSWYPIVLALVAGFIVGWFVNELVFDAARWDALEAKAHEGFNDVHDAAMVLYFGNAFVGLLVAAASGVGAAAIRNMVRHHH